MSVRFGEWMWCDSLWEWGRICDINHHLLYQRVNVIDSCCQMQKKGSFLGRNKESLAKIAELTKTSINPTGVRNSRNFVFQVISPDKDTNKQVSVVISVGDFFYLDVLNLIVKEWFSVNLCTCIWSCVKKKH